MLDQVAGQPDRAGEGVGVDRLGPAVVEVGGQMQQPGEAAGGAGELGRPPGQMGQVAAAGGQPRLQIALDPLGSVRRHDRLGGLLHEYQPVA